MNDYYVKREFCLGDPIFFSLYRKLFKHNHNADPKVAWCLIREYPLKEMGKKDGDLMMIYANETGQGLGLELLNRVKEDFEIIRTQWDASTVQGRELCLKAGFVREENILIYRKEKANAVQIKKSEAIILRENESRGDIPPQSGGMGKSDTKQTAP